jgi:uncharacterized membrane protein
VAAPGSVATDLDDPPVARERKAKAREEHEVEFGRIVAFSDGVFSIAITLLVLAITIEPGIPHDELAKALWERHEALLAYAISFAVIGRFWVVHHSFFSEVTAFDGKLIALNMFYLGWIVLIPFSSQVLGEYGGQVPSIVLYSANLCAVILVGQWMAWDARRAGLTKIDRQTHLEGMVRSLYIACVFLLSIAIAFINANIAPFTWFLLFAEPSGHLVKRLSARGR